MDTEDQQRAEIERLRAALADRDRESAAKERQLEVYAADLRETFKQERARALELRSSYAATVRALADAVEARDAYTGHHAQRVAAYGLLLAAEYGIDLAAQPELEFGFLLHDIGKVAVPDGVLFKAGALAPDERDMMQNHPAVGFEILREVEFLGGARLVVRHHHERWDGKGYPDMLAGEAIPVAARVFAVADTLDAITTDRPYRKGVDFAAARVEIAAHAGTQFDPAAVAALERVPDDELAHARDAIGL